jgi:hypothetical protein
MEAAIPDFNQLRDQVGYEVRASCRLSPQTHFIMGNISTTH